jgi:hypothetical protein
MNASVNAERILLTITGSFEGIHRDFVKISVKFSLLNQQEFFCTIQTIQNDRFYRIYYSNSRLIYFSFFLV